MYIKNLTILTALTFFSFSSVYASKPHESELLLNSRDLQKTKVSLAFPYQEIPQSKRVKMVLERGVAILKPNDSYDYIVVGTLQPCIGILLYNPENGYILGAHKHWTNDLKTLTQYYEQLKVTDPSQVKGQIYTVNMKSYVETGWLGSHEGRTQIQELKVVKDFLVETFKIPRENIKASKFISSLEDNALGDYELAELSFGMDKKGQVFNTCFMAEDLLKLTGRSFMAVKGFSYLYEQAPAETRVVLTTKELNKIVWKRFFSFNEIDNERDLNTYGKVPFYYFES